MKLSWPPKLSLSPRGRERFGELLAKQLWLTAGGVVVLILVPGLLGSAKLAPAVLVLCAVVALAFVVSGTLLHYVTVERASEATPVQETPDA